MVKTDAQSPSTFQIRRKDAPFPPRMDSAMVGCLLIKEEVCVNDGIPSLKDRTKAFLRIFREDCRNCLRKGDCYRCRASTAVNLLREYELNAPIEPIRELTIMERIRSVTEQLTKASRPLLCSEIFLDCSKSLKEWTINSMLHSGKLLRRKRTERNYEYFLPRKTRNKNHKG